MTFDEQKKCYMPKKRKNSLSKSSVKETLKENAAGGLHPCSGNPYALYFDGQEVGWCGNNCFPSKFERFFNAKASFITSLTHYNLLYRLVVTGLLNLSDYMNFKFPCLPILEMFVRFCEFICVNTFSDIIIDGHYWLRCKQRFSFNFLHLYYHKTQNGFEGISGRNYEIA